MSDFLVSIPSQFKTFFEKYKLQFPVWGVLFIFPFAISTLFPFLSTSTKWFTVYAGIIMFLFMFPSRFLVPKWNRMTIFLFLALVGSIGLNHFLFKTPLFSCTTIDRLGFLILVLYFYQYFNRGFDFKSFSVPIIITTPIILLDAFSFILLKSNFLFLSRGLASTFANINMLTQFLGFSIVFQLYHRRVSKNSLHKTLLTGLIIFSLVFLYFGSSRSAIVGIICIFSMAYFLKFVSFKDIGIFLLATVCMIFAIKGLDILIQHLQSSSASSTLNNPLTAFDSVITKKEFGERWSLIKSALWLFWENPFLGIGPDHFQFSYLPFAKAHNFAIFERTVARSPHSEFLRFLAEQGLLTVALFLSFFGFLIYKNHKKIWQIRQHNSFKILILLGTFLIIEMLFQFPIELPFPFFLFSAMVGYALTLLGGHKEFSFPTQGMTAAVRMALVGFFSLLTIMRFVTLYTEQNYPQDYDMAALVCRIDPSNWSVCLRKARLELKNNQLAEGRKTLTEVIKRYPYNFFAIHLWYMMEYLEAKPLESCETALLYGNMFNLETHKVSKFLNEFCASHYRLPLPLDIRQHYQLWWKKRFGESTQTS